MKMVINPLNRKWEFETNQGYLADMFLQILELFHIEPQDIYIPSFLDMSQIEFRTTKDKREQIDYVFRNYIGIDSFRMNKSMVELEGGDWYAIY